jgi:hypothetical protein
VGGKMALKNTIATEDSKRLRFMHKHVNKIVIIVWTIVKHIVTTLEDKDDDSHKEILNPSSKPHY